MASDTRVHCTALPVHKFTVERHGKAHASRSLRYACRSNRESETLRTPMQIKKTTPNLPSATYQDGREMLRFHEWNQYLCRQINVFRTSCVPAIWSLHSFALLIAVKLWINWWNHFRSALAFAKHEWSFLGCLLPGRPDSNQAAGCACKTNNTIIKIEISKGGGWYGQVADIGEQLQIGGCSLPRHLVSIL